MLRNFIEYRKKLILPLLITLLIDRFPIDLIKDIFILLWFQEHCGRIYESYIKRIINQNVLVSQKPPDGFIIL